MPAVHCSTDALGWWRQLGRRWESCRRHRAATCLSATTAVGAPRGGGWATPAERCRRRPCRRRGVRAPLPPTFFAAVVDASPARGWWGSRATAFHTAVDRRGDAGPRRPVSLRPQRRHDGCAWGVSRTSDPRKRGGAEWRIEHGRCQQRDGDDVPGGRRLQDEGGKGDAAQVGRVRSGNALPIHSYQDTRYSGLGKTGDGGGLWWYVLATNARRPEKALQHAVKRRGGNRIGWVRRHNNRRYGATPEQSKTEALRKKFPGYPAGSKRFSLTATGDVLGLYHPSWSAEFRSRGHIDGTRSRKKAGSDGTLIGSQHSSRHCQPSLDYESLLHNAHAYSFFFTVIAFIHPIINSEMKGDRVPLSRQNKQ